FSATNASAASCSAARAAKRGPSSCINAGQPTAGAVMLSAADAEDIASSSMSHASPRPGAVTARKSAWLAPMIQSKICTGCRRGVPATSASPAQEGPMRAYGQFCPVAKAAEVFAERWTPLVVRELLAGSAHFNDLHRGIPLMSRTLLSQRLKQLEGLGVVTRTRGARGSEYGLTEAGRELAPLVQLLGEWGQRRYRTRYVKEELDVRVLMWDLRRMVKPEAFPPGRVCAQFEFSDVPATKRTWWLVSSESEVDLCPTDPGF